MGTDTVARIQMPRNIGPVPVIATILVLLVLIRDPAFLLSPRIWAEEGSIYIQSYLDSGLSSNSLLEPHLGYYSLFVNLITGLSVEWLGLQFASYGTTYASLLFMLVCVLAPFYLPSSFWPTTRLKTLLVLASILVASPEIWLNTINIQFYFGLFTCYLLLSDTQKLPRFVYLLSIILLILCALSGVTSIVFLPLYLLSSRQRGNTPGCKHSRLTPPVTILAFGAGVQMAAFLTTQDTTTGDRLSFDDIVNLPAGVLRNLYYLVQGNSETVSILFLVLLTISLAVGVIYRRRARIAAGIAIYVAVVFSVLSIEMKGGGRYDYIPSVMLILSLLNFWHETGPRMSFALTTLGVLFLGYKLQFYFDVDRFYHPAWQSFAEEYTESVACGKQEVSIFPHWEGTSWTIQLE